MKRLLQILILLAFTAPAFAAKLAHDLSVESLDCSGADSRYPHSFKEQLVVSADWLSKSELKVSFWQSEDSEQTVRRRDLEATVEGRRIDLTLQTDRVVFQPDVPIPSCAWLARVTVVVHGISRGKYELFIHRDGDSRATEIND